MITNKYNDVIAIDKQIKRSTSILKYHLIISKTSGIPFTLLPVSSGMQVRVYRLIALKSSKRVLLPNFMSIF